MTTAIETRLPRQVQNAAARARQILEDQKKANVGKPAAPNGAVLIDNTEVPITSLTTPTQAAPSTDDEGRDFAYWKHRAQTLDGALKSAKQKHGTIVSDLQTQIETLKLQLRDATEALAAAAPVKVEDYFSPEEIETLGREEALIMATKIAAAQRNAVKGVRAEMQAAAPSPAAPAVASPPPTVTAEDVESPEETAFYDELERLVPKIWEVNKDKRFLAFTGTTDDATGMKYQQILNAAKRDLNALAAAKVFRAFERSLNVVDAPAPTAAPDARNSGGRNDPPAPPPPGSAAGRPTKGEIAEHFKNRSVYHHRPDHPKHVTEEQNKAFLARLQPAA